MLGIDKFAQKKIMGMLSGFLKDYFQESGGVGEVKPNSTLRIDIFIKEDGTFEILSLKSVTKKES